MRPGGDRPKQGNEGEKGRVRHPEWTGRVLLVLTDCHRIWPYPCFVKLSIRIWFQSRSEKAVNSFAQ